MAYVGKTSQAAMLQAFLFWNLVHSTRHIANRLKTSHEQFSAYWMATRLRYESWIANGSPMPLGIPSLRIKNASLYREDPLTAVKEVQVALDAVKAQYAKKLAQKR